MVPERSTPPVGFRKAIPIRVRLQVILNQGGLCRSCGERLADVDNCRFDHRPPIQLRGWDAEAGDTIPGVNDPAAIEALHKDCHDVRTTGRRGESKLSTRDGDVAAIAKLRRVTKDQEVFQRRLLAKSNPDEEPAPAKRKFKWPSRPFETKSKKRKGNV